MNCVKLCQFNRLFACSRQFGTFSIVNPANLMTKFCINRQLTSPSSLCFADNFRNNYCTKAHSSVSNDAYKGLIKKRLARATSKNERLREGFWSAVTYAVADELHLEKLMQGLIKQGLYETNEMPEDVVDCLRITAKYKVSEEPREIFVFRDGSVVFWNVHRTERLEFLAFLKTYASNYYDDALINEEHEMMEYSYADNGPRLVNGKFVLKSGVESMDLAKYTFSNSLALSVKLSIWEKSFEDFIDGIEEISQDLKNGRKIRLPRREVMKKMGELFNYQHIINLSSDLLDTPDFYWEREDLEPLFLITCSHLSLPKRTKIMNDRLSHCQELIQLVNDHLTDAHHVRLEGMIIILITLEVIFEIIHWF